MSSVMTWKGMQEKNYRVTKRLLGLMHILSYIECGFMSIYISKLIKSYIN